MAARQSKGHRRRRGNGQGTLFQRNGRGCWIAKWLDHNGERPERSTKTVDKAAAQRMLSKWTTEAMLRRTGTIDARAEALAQQSRRPLAEHLDEFEASLLAKGVTSQHAGVVLSRARRVVLAVGFTAWGDVVASRAMEYIKGLRADTESRNEAGETVKVRRGISAQTFNFYLGALKQFGRWMVRDRRAADNPFAYLEPLNVRLDRRRDRRALAIDEMRTLIAVTEAGPERFGMTGAARGMLYRLAVESGLRAGELRSLTCAGFSLDGAEPTVTVGAAYSKHRREDTIPLRPDLAGLLKKHLAGKDPTDPAFDAPTDRHDFADMFQEDLAAAGIEYRDGSGRVADFHALRHTFISNLAAGGVYPKTAQALARHSTITLTMDRYTHGCVGDERAALAALPDLMMPAVAAKALGTDGSLATPTSSPTSSIAARCASVANGCGNSERRGGGGDAKNVNEHAGFGGLSRNAAKHYDTNGGDSGLVAGLVFKTSVGLE